MVNPTKQQVIDYLEETIKDLQSEVFSREEEGRYNNRTLHNKSNILDKAITVLEK